jgi:hypothetical protein
MMSVNVIQLTADCWHSFYSWNDLGQIWSWDWQIDSMVLAAKSSGVRDANILGQIQQAFDNFIKSGQVWAMLIGLTIGYLLKGITN